jgi:hypothetical protein
MTDLPQSPLAPQPVLPLNDPWLAMVRIVATMCILQGVVAVAASAMPLVQPMPDDNYWQLWLQVPHAAVGIGLIVASLGCLRFRRTARLWLMLALGAGCGVAVVWYAIELSRFGLTALLSWWTLHWVVAAWRSVLVPVVQLVILSLRPVRMLFASPTGRSS